LTIQRDRVLKFVLLAEERRKMIYIRWIAVEIGAVKGDRFLRFL